MKTKEEVIKEAWGKYWNDVENEIDCNGLIESSFKSDILMDLEVLDGFDRYGSKTTFIRPKLLKGIENNNGWISINSVEDLPIEDGEYYVINRFHGGMSTLQSYGNIQETKHVCKSWIHNYSHYQPIVKPLKPIY